MDEVFADGVPSVSSSGDEESVTSFVTPDCECWDAMFADWEPFEELGVSVMGDDARRSDGGPVSVAIDPTTLRIESGYLVEVTDDCNCSGTDVNSGHFQHEPGCGLWPLMTVGELAALISSRD